MMISEIFKAVFMLSIAGTVVTFLIFLIKHFTKKTFSNTWHYYIWLIVVLRFIIPYTFSLGNMNTYSEGTLNAAYDIINDEVSQKNNFNETDGSINYFQEAVPYYNEQITNIYYKNPMVYIPFIWLMVSLAILFKKVAAYFRFVIYIKKAYKPITDSDIIRVYNNACADLKIKRMPDLYVSNIIASPMFIGILKPRIILPDKQLANINNTSLSYILKHELIHYKRIDIYYKWLVEIVASIHWFNPAIYLIRKEVRRLCELSCDEMVIKRLNKEEQRGYGDTLLNSLEMSSGYANKTIPLALSTNSKLMKERLRSIMRFKKKSKINTCTSLVMGTLLFTSAMFIGVNAGVKVETVSKSKPATKQSLDTLEVSHSDFNQSGVNLSAFSLYWASASGFDPNTYSVQIEEKLKYIEETYNDKKELFLITETIPESEITNTLGIKYMFDNSEVYRNAVKAPSALRFTPWTNINTSIGVGREGPQIDRNTFWVEKDSVLELSSSYSLDKGKISVLLVSPEGDVIYKNQLERDFNETEHFDVYEGLWSVIKIYEYEDRLVQGYVDIKGTISNDYKQVQSKPYKTRAESLVNDFEAYKNYGVIYDKEKDSVFYNGEEVKLFVDYQKDTAGYSFRLCYNGSKNLEGLCLEVVRDENDKITAIKQMDRETAKELTGHLDIDVPVNTSKQNEDKYSFSTYDATSVLASLRVTATDNNLLKSNAPNWVQDKIALCDNKTGAYLIENPNNGSDLWEAYIYYNGGGRYPWKMTNDGDTLLISFISGDRKSDDGYCLLHITAPNKKTINLSIGNNKLELESY